MTPSFPTRPSADLQRLRRAAGSGASSWTSAITIAGPPAMGDGCPWASVSIMDNAPLAASGPAILKGVIVVPLSDTNPTFRSPLNRYVAIRIEPSCIIFVPSILLVLQQARY